MPPGDYFSLIDDLNRKKHAREAGMTPEELEAGVLADRERLRRDRERRERLGQLRARPKHVHRADLFG